MNNIARFVLVLFLVNFVAATILAGVYNLTKSRIETQQALAEEEALKGVMPEIVGDRLEAMEGDGNIKYWKVFKGSSEKVRGYVFIAKKYGYSSVIDTMVGMKADGTITGITILNHNETPGLGSKIAEVVSNETILKALKEIFLKEEKVEKETLPYFTEQLKGVNVRNVELSKYGIEAITGATITSRAFVESIKSEGSRILDAER